MAVVESCAWLLNDGIPEETRPIAVWWASENAVKTHTRCSRNGRTNDVARGSVVILSSPPPSPEKQHSIAGIE